MNRFTHSLTEPQKNGITVLMIGLVLASIVLIFFASRVTCATHSGSCGNGHAERGGDGGCAKQGTCGGVVVTETVVVYPPPPPPPPPCYLTTSARVVQAGTTTLQLSWTPTPSGAVYLQRSHNGSNRTLTVPSGATGVNDTLKAVADRSISYSLSYNVRNSRGRDVQHQCSGSVSVVSKLTECNDQIDNTDTEDSLADRFDPGCHTDGNPNNSSTYDPLDPSEVNTPPDMVPTVSAASRTRAGVPVSVTATAENKADTFASANTLVYGWRNMSASAPMPSCGNGFRWWSRSRCFEQGGKTYQTLNTYDQSYSTRQKRTAPIRSFRPSAAGRYEVCAVADFKNTIDEGTAGERNNVACTTVNVDSDDPNEPPTGPTITGAIDLIVAPGRVRKGSETTVTWNTNGREQCTITGSNGHIIDLTGESSSASEATPPITAETIYRMTCADDGATAEGKVGILPVLQEI